jgi:hypothetical protein
MKLQVAIAIGLQLQCCRLLPILRALRPQPSSRASRKKFLA